MTTAGQVISCRAAVAREGKNALSIETIQVSPPRENEVRVKLLYGAICHTDCFYIEGKGPGAPFWPRILGHEAAGVVESVGEGVTEFTEGDPVIPLYQAQCNNCFVCQNEATNWCISSLNLTGGYPFPSQETRFSTDGKPIYHFFNISTFSEYTVVHQGNLVKVNPDARLDRVFLLGCGVSTGHGAVEKIAEVKPGSTVAIFGLGTIGLAVAQAAVSAGATHILGVDINPKKFPLAKQFGVTKTVNPKDFDRPIVEVLKEMTGGAGVMYSFECVGANEEVMTSAIHCCNPFTGTAVLLGSPRVGQQLKCDPMQLLLGLKVKGVFFGGYKGRTDVPRLIEKYMKKELDLDKFITAELPFSRINEAYEMLMEGNCIRCVLDYSK